MISLQILLPQHVRKITVPLLLSIIVSGCDKQVADNASVASKAKNDVTASGSAGGPPASMGGVLPQAPVDTTGSQDSRKMARAHKDQEYAKFHQAANAPMAGNGGRLNPNMYVSNTYIGGTGAKDRLEKLIDEGVLVDGKRIKLEAFSRNYAQAFSIPTRTALSVTAQTERSRIVQEGDHTYLQVGLQALKGELPRRAPLNIVLVMDRSGSMASEDKMENAKAAAMQLVNSLRPEDSFSLIAFDDEAQTLLPSVTVKDRARVKKIIAALEAGGGTNIYAGLSSGFREAQKHAGRETINRVLLLSDGEVTAGVKDAAAFQHLVSVNADKDIQTTSVGLGIEFNEDLMLSIARDGKGNYHFIKDGADTRSVFAKELDELTHVVARAVKVRVQLAEGVGLVRVLGAETLDAAQTKQVKAEERKIDRKVADELGIATNRQNDKDESGIKLLIPNFYRGDNHVMMMELSVPRGFGTRKIADVSVKYKDLVTNTNQEQKSTTAITYTNSRSEAIASINRNVKKNLLGFQTGEALVQAASLIEQGQFANAVRKLDDRMVVLGVAAREWHDKDLDGDGKLLDRYKTVLTQAGRDRQTGDGEFGQYLKKSLTYAGYRMTR